MITTWNSVARRAELLARLADNRKPGFIGNVPYLFYLRVLILVAVTARYLMPGAIWTPNPWWFWGIAPAMAGASLIHSWAFRKQQRDGGADVRRPITWLVHLDSASISALYYATNTVTSDFYLFFYLPLLEAAEYLRFRWNMTVAAVSAIGLGLALWAMPGGEPGDKIVLFGMRMVFLGCFVAVSLVLTRIQALQNLRLQQSEAEARSSLQTQQQLNRELRQRQAEMTALLELSGHLNAEFDEKRMVARATSDIEGAGGEFQLVAEAGILGTGETRVSDGRLTREEQEAFVTLAARVGGNALGTDRAGDCDIVLVPLRLHQVHYGSLWAVGRKGVRVDSEAETFWRLAGGIISTALAKARRMEAYREISRLGAESAQQDFEVEKTLRLLVVELGFEFACVSVKDKYSGRVRMVRARNVPPGWMNRSDYAAGATDILADIIRTGKTEVIPGWDPRFNREIYDKFGHEQLVRMYTPIFVNGEAVGVLEVGGRKERQEELFTAGRRQFVVAEADRISEFIDGISDSRFFEKIAEKAVGILGPGAATIHVFQQDREGKEHVVLQAGRGSIDPKKVQSLGLACADKQAEQAEQAIREEGIPSCRVLPLDAGDGRRGQLALLYWESNPEFTESGKAVAESYARLVESLIWTVDTIRETRTRAKLGWTASSLQCVLQSLVADPGSAKSVPDNLVYHLQAMLDADNIVLYERRGDGRLLVPVRRGKLSGDPKGGWTGRSELVSALLEKGEHRFLTSGGIDDLQCREDAGFGDRFAKREGVVSCAALVLRPREGAAPVGVLFANYHEAREFDEETKAMMRALAQTAAIALRTAQTNERVQQAAEQWQKEMAALVEVEQIVLQHRGVDDPDKILRKILEHAVDITQARHGVIVPWDSETKLLVPKRELVVGFSDTLPPPHPKGDGIVGEAAKRQKPILLGDLDDLSHPDRKFYRNTIQDTKSQLAVPLLDGDELLGVFSLEHPDAHHFKPEHIPLLQTLSLQAILAIRMVELVQEVEHQRAPLSALTEVTGRIRDRRLHGERALRLVLTGITAGTGLGFNRAAIYSRRGDWLIGRVAVGPIDKTEAGVIWPKLSKSTPVTALLAEAERFGLAVEGGTRDCKLSEWVKGRQSRWDAPVEDNWLPSPAPAGTVVVPIIAGDSNEVLGYIAGDRAITQPNKPGSDSDSLLLRQFGQLAADILRRESLASLSGRDREWHENLRAILHDVAPYFDRALAALPAGQRVEKSAGHIRRGVRELSRLKDFPWTEVPIHQFNLVNAIGEVRASFSDVDVDWQPPSGEVLVFGSQRKIEIALMALFQNAIEQRPPERGLTISVRLTVFGGEGQPQATIEVEDNAGGRLDEVGQRIFVRRDDSPKGPGRGRGTARVKQTIEEFGGSVSCEQSTSGIVVLLRLPAAGRGKVSAAGV